MNITTPHCKLYFCFPSTTDISGIGDSCNVSTNGLTHVQQPVQISHVDGSTLQVLCEPGWQYSNSPLDVQRQYTCNSGAWATILRIAFVICFFCNLKPIDALCVPVEIFETGNSHNFIWGNQQNFYLTQYDLHMNRCHWRILAGSENRFVWDCLNRGK